MYFKTLHRATFAQAPEGTAYEVGDEVIVETTYDSETYRSSMRIVGPAVSKEQTPSPEAFVRTRTADETDGAIQIDLPALRTAMKTIEEHADLIDACFRYHTSPVDSNANIRDRKFARSFVSGLWFLVVDGWRPQDEPRSP